MKPIYKPSGKAAEYGDLSINIYTGCNHRCTYCFAPLVLKRDREVFHSVVEPRNGIIEAVKRQLDKEQITRKLIHLCFTCDPYPADIDTTPTREIIKAIKDSGNHVQILTKGGKRAERDFDLLDENDWFGVTYSGYHCGNSDVEQPIPHEPNASFPYDRIMSLISAKSNNIKTWVSCEPVYYPDDLYLMIKNANYIDLFRIGKLNYVKNDTDWAAFGHECERLCKQYNRNYYIKDGLRKIMGVKSNEQG